MVGEGAQWYKYDVAGAKKLLGEAGYPSGFKAVMDAPNAASYGQRTVDEGGRKQPTRTPCSAQRPAQATASAGEGASTEITAARGVLTRKPLSRS